MIPLIDKLDGFETVRDQVATILAAETLRQQTLAEDAEKDPAPWKFRVFTERRNPWDSFLSTSPDTSPIAHVWYDGSTYDKTSSNVSTRQKATSRIMIDVLAYATSKATQSGHTPGDESAARAAQATARQIRNILMHDYNKYLQLGRGIVWIRWIASINTFLLPNTEPAAAKVAGVRITLEVDHNETIPQEDEQTIDTMAIEFKHTPEGETIAEWAILPPGD